jgi:hypothetical protein
VSSLSKFLLVADKLPELPEDESEEMAFLRFQTLEAKFETEEEENEDAIAQDVVCIAKEKVQEIMFCSCFVFSLLEFVANNQDIAAVDKKLSKMVAGTKAWEAEVQRGESLRGLLAEVQIGVR